MSALGAAAGVVLDEFLGEPPLAWHPVARFGEAMRSLEPHLYADRRSRGIVFTACGVGFACGTGWIVRRLLGRHAGTALAVAICSAGRMLDVEAQAMAALLGTGDVPAARVRVRSLAGRDAERLGTGELSRAVIESAAENLVDAVTATLWWGAVAGPIGAFGHRACNTLDAMVGYRNDRYAHFGWASARLDDLLNAVPARLGVLAVALVRPRRAADVWRIVRRDARRHPSPNGGVVEAAFAAALGVGLGGVNRYGSFVEDRGTLGDGPLPGIADIAAAVRLRRDTTALSTTVVAVAGVIAAYRRRST